MDKRARTLLEKLLARGNKLTVGRRSRSAALTATDLGPYRKERSLKAKEDFEATMRAARAQGAIKIIWDNEQGEEGFIRRVDLIAPKLLADFIGQIPLEDQLLEASSKFNSLKECFPVLNEVLQLWSNLRTIRKLGPDSVQKWLDAVLVIQKMREQPIENAVSVPVREMSARLFKDSKRIESLSSTIDILLSGSIETDIRTPDAVWQEIGLFKEEQPVRLSGNIRVERDRVIAILDVPYTGLPAATIKRLVDTPKMILSIENLTTFHSEARRRFNESILLLYTAGMPSPAWRAMYTRILHGVPAEVPVYHWGDVDEGGFRIAARLAQDAQVSGHNLQPWYMHPSQIPEHLRKKASTRTLERIQHYASVAGWTELGEAIVAAGFTIEQESL